MNAVRSSGYKVIGFTKIELVAKSQFQISQIFQTMNSVRSNNVSLKYQRPTPSGCKDIWIRKFECVAKTQFLSDGKYHSQYGAVPSASV